MNVGEYRSDYAAYCSALELAHYQHRAGFEHDLDLTPIYDRYGHLFTLDAIQSLERAHQQISESRETERSGLQKLSASAKTGYLESKARELTSNLSRCNSAQHIEWSGESVPTNNVLKLISNEPIASRRRDLSARWTDQASHCDDLRSLRFESFHNSARELGFASYRALCTEATGVDYERLARSGRDLLDRTDSAYTTALAHAIKRDLPDVAFEELRHADYLYFQRMPRHDRSFPSKGLMTTYEASMRSLGINIGLQTNIHIDHEDRPFKNPRAACFRIHPPDDVRLLLAPVGGSHDYTVLFHEAGHAQHFGWSSRDLVKRHPEFLYTPDNSAAEGYAFLFSNLFLDMDWLMEHHIAADRSHAQEIVRDLAVVVGSSVRRRCGSLNYEIELHDSSNTRSERLAALYADTLSQATGFRRNPALYLTDVDDGFCSAAYLRAWAFEALLSDYLRTRYGRRWWASRKCGDELIDLWNTASRYSVEELAQHMGLGEINFDLLIENLLTAMNRK